MRARPLIRIGQVCGLGLSLTLVSAAQPAPAPDKPRPPAAHGAPNQPPSAAPGQPTPAQPAPVPAQVPTEPGAQPALPTPGEATPEPAPGTETAPSAAPKATPQAEEPKPAPGEVPLAPPALHPVPAEPAGKAAVSAHWYDALHFRLFADSYFSLNYNFPKPQRDANAAVRAYDTSNGFALAWVGADVSYPAEPVGGTLALRFGPAAERLARTCLVAPCDSDVGLTPVKQAFASWRPGGAGSAVRLDFGKFDTIYGVEVAESQDNINYTRGLLYWFAQPAFHTGLRFTGDFSEAFTLKAILVNGYNNSVDNNVGKTLGLQGTLNLKDGESSLGNISLGYLVGPEREDTKLIECAPGQVFDPTNGTGCVSSAGSPGESRLADRMSTNTKGLRHLIDLVAVLSPVEKLNLQFNGDYGTERVRDSVDENRFVARSWYGVMAGARYGLSDKFGIAGRGEYLRDGDGHVTGFGEEVNLVSGTLTLDFLPANFLVVRLENRLDWSSKQIFQKGVRFPATAVERARDPDNEPRGTLVTTTLGVVVTTP